MNSFSAIRFALFLTTALIVQGPVLAESDYPAAYFEPYIVYQAPDVAGNAPVESESAASKPAEESPYPAAYFEPVIVYQDKDMIAAQEKQKAAKPKPAPVKKAKPSPAAAAPPVTDEGGFPMSVVVLLVAVIGGLYWVMTKNKDEAAADEEPVEAESSENEEEGTGDDSEGETGGGENQPQG